MKKILFISVITLTMSFVVNAQKSGLLTINTSYKGIIEGYDHINKTQLYIDGNLAGESSQGLQSVPNSFSVRLSQGDHRVRIVNLAFYENNWEEHTKNLGYSLDAFYEGQIKLKKKMTISLVFDIGKETTEVTIK